MIQWYLRTHLSQNPSNLVLVAFDEEQCFSAQRLLTTHWTC